MNVRIASSPDSWGVFRADDPGQPPWSRFLDESAAVGYEGIELGPDGYLPTEADVLRRELGSRGLKVIGANAVGTLHDPTGWPEIEEIVERRSALLGELGAEYIVLIGDAHTDPFTGEQLLEKTLDQDGWARTVEISHRTAELSRKNGIQLTFHPHASGHIEYEDQIEEYLEKTDPTLVSLCLDTGHHAYKGGEPVSFMRKHHERIPYFHLKTVHAETLRRVNAESIPIGKATAMGAFCEPAEGVVDFPALRRLLEEIDYDGWAVVEQDMRVQSWDVPLPIAKRTRQYFKDIGLG